MTNPSDADRIRLAEAMGWVLDRSEKISNSEDDKFRWTDIQGRKCDYCPDPFTDANDDYAVLEWFRDKYPYTNKQVQEAFGDELLCSEWGVPAYQIGDYARAALKVLNND